MSKKVTAFGFIFSIALAAMVFGANHANAQVGISLFPIKFDVTVAPGQTYSDTVTVINPNDFPIGVQPEIENISGGNQGSIDLVETDIPHGLSSWIIIDQTEFSLDPHQEKQIPFSITIPTDGEPGGHYGAILFRGLPSASSTTPGVGISGRVGSVILVNVPGAALPTGNIASFIGPGSYVSHGPVNFSFTVNDTGNTHFSPQGQITMQGPLFPPTVVPFTTDIIFPGFDRTFTATWPGHYGFGPVTAVLSLTMPDGTIATQTVSFFMFPWQEALAIILIVVILWLILTRFKKNFRIVRVKDDQ